MTTIFRWLLRAFILIGAIAAITFAAGWWFASQSLPDYTATYRVARINAPVEIVRNNANVPHIFGETDADVFFGLGFVHAQDRLWQMAMLRRTAQGRLSELFGERTLRFDEILRRLDLYNLADSSVKAQDPRTKAALSAYSAGVNAWINQVKNRSLGRGAPEFLIFPSELDQWRPADSLAIIKLMSLQLSTHFFDEVLRARTSLALADDRIADILPEAPGAGIAALPEYAAIAPALPRRAEAKSDTGTADPLDPVQRRGLGGASNAWAAGPSRSASGGTLLANDPHLRFSAPTTWYLVRLELSTGGVIGGSIPGIPVVLVGRSEKLGWGLTSSYLDDQDLYIEKLNPDNPNEVLTPDGFVSMERRPSTIYIKDSNALAINLQWTQNGPVLPPHLYDLGSITPEGHVTSLAWTALSPADTSLSAAIALMRAENVAEGLAAGEGFIAPSQNLILADAEKIAMKVIGRMPRRAARHQTQGRLPSRGWIAENRWQGQINYGANPEFLAPVGGIVGNTNNKLVDRAFPFHVSYSYGDTQRILRWRFLMQNREVHTKESFIEAQLDNISRSARALLSLVAKDLWYTSGAAPTGTPERRRQDALRLLANWNGDMNEHRPEPLIYSAWLRALQQRLIQDELGPLAREFPHVEPLFIERVYRDISGAAIWCDVLQSEPVENCTDIARLALDDALVWINENFSGTLESLRWGDAHQATHDHPVLGRIPVLKFLVNIRQSTSGGDNTLSRGRTSGKDPRPFLNVHGAGYRGVYDFADPDSSVFIISTGQSGHPLSSHYDNLGDLWRRGEYITMSLDPELARAGALGITTLNPAVN